MDFLAFLIIIPFFGLIFFLIYSVIVFLANRRTRTYVSDYTKEFVDGEIGEKGIKMTLKVKDWFNWNIQTNNEKGTAGGNIKINFPVKSALGVALICFLICITSAIIPPTKYLVPVIMFSFGVYYLIKWWRALRVIKSMDEWYEHSEIHALAQKRLYRTSDGQVLAGVCAGISDYTGIRVGYTRVGFVFITFATGGIAALGYGLLWWVVPNKD